MSKITNDRHRIAVPIWRQWVSLLTQFLLCPDIWRCWRQQTWIPRPDAETYASTVVVKSAPANFSFWVFLPLITGTASSCS